MKLLSAKQQKWLKAVHVLFASIWIGCAVALTLSQIALPYIKNINLFGVLQILDFIDIFVLVPAATGTFLTGLMYSSLTRWGWFKHNWIVVKWGICIFGIGFGYLCLGPWLWEMKDIAKIHGAQSFGIEAFEINRQLLIWFGGAQALTLIFASSLAIFKPWNKRRDT